MLIGTFHNGLHFLPSTSIPLTKLAHKGNNTHLPDMHVTLGIADGQKQKLLKGLGVTCIDCNVQIVARPDQLDKLLLAARVQCLSKV
jgi:hypothetical protein